MTDEIERLLKDQIRYYDDRAPVYEALWFRRGDHDMGSEWNAAWFRETAIVEGSADAVDGTGSVLELACGSGLWTRRFAPRSRRYVAVDSSPTMLQLNRERFGAPHVEYVGTDVFEWVTTERFDLVVLGFFLSHIPPDLFAGWWGKVRAWLAPGGLVWFCDDGSGGDRPYSGDVVREGPPFAHRRSLEGGREYTIVKVFYGADDLRRKIETLGWSVELQRSGVHFLYGTARPLAN